MDMDMDMDMGMEMNWILNYRERPAEELSPTGYKTKSR
jgi:hypothetical protein